VGSTTNPSYCLRILNDPEDAPYAKELLKGILRDEKDDAEALGYLQRSLVEEVARRFLPLYESTGGKQGYVSVQGDPFREDKDSILRFARLNCTAPNIMAKIPAIPSGLEAAAILAAEGVPVLLTECFAVRQVIDSCEMYVEATKSLSNPAPMYFALITGIYDEYMHNQVSERQSQVDRDALWQAGFSIAKKVYEIVKQRRYPCGFMGGGARGLHHFTEMVGADASITINWKGAAEDLIKLDLPVVNRFSQPTPHEVVDELTEKLEDYRKAYYINSIKPEEYEAYGPVALFRKMFEDAWENGLQITNIKS
jgi:transaldolase